MAGRYRLLSRLRMPKEFAAGEIPRWRAVDLTDRTDVWILFADDGRVTSGEDRLLTALHTMRRIEDPVVPEVVDIGESDGVGFAVIRPVRGRVLAKTLVHGAFSPQERAELVQRATAALSALRQAAIGHGRLRPSSLILTDDGVVIVDLPVALALAQDVPADPAADAAALAWLMTITLTGVAAAREAWGDGFALCYVDADVLAARTAWAATVLPASGVADEIAMQLVAALRPAPPTSRPGTALAVIEPHSTEITVRVPRVIVPMAEIFDDRTTPAHAAPSRTRRELTVAAVTVLVVAAVLGIIIGVRGNSTATAAGSGGAGAATATPTSTASGNAVPPAAALAAVTTASTSTSSTSPTSPTATTTSPSPSATTSTATTAAGATSSSAGTTAPGGPGTSTSQSNPPPPPTPGCSANIAVTNAWNNGYVASVTVTNTGSVAITGWTVTFTLPHGQQISNAWNANVSQPRYSRQVTATNMGYNGALKPQGSTQWGMQVQVDSWYDGAPGGVSCQPN